MRFETVSVVGLGYIGLPTAAILASRGLNVIGVDVNQNAVNTINNGDIHIVEPDLDIVVRAAVATGKLRAVTSAEASDAFMIAVPTPFKENKEPDLSYIKAAAESIAPVLGKGNLVVLESTSPVGATEQMAKWLAEYREDLTFPQTHGEKADILVAHCPERVLPGYVLQELVSNDRVIGGMSRASSNAAVELYKTFVKAECLITNARTAEMAKLTENSYRDVNIAFANELSIICDKLKINVWELISLANRHPRVDILNPGPGVGGHCIAVDPWFIVSSAPEEAKLISQARQVNDYKPEYVLQRIKEAADRFKSPRIALLGLSFKADIDDLRESPALKIAEDAVGLNLGEVVVVEPHITSIPKSLESKAVLVDANEAFESADVLVLLVDHQAFKEISLSDLVNHVVIDTRGCWQG